jgi:DNA replication protein DnaC
MNKTCRCGKSYDAGVGPLLLPVCPDCSDAWDAEIDSRIPKETKVIDEEASLDALGIRPRHYSCTFDTFVPRDEEDRRSLEYCKRMAEARRGLIALIGNNGTGKTHLACATVREIGAGRIYKMIEVGMFIRAGFEDGKSEQGQLDALVKLPFLAIDEADKSKRTDNEMNWLSYLIDERLERYRPTIIIANAHPKKNCTTATCDKCFESIMTPDVLDRFTQFGVIQYFSGESHRRELRGKE